MLLPGVEGWDLDESSPLITEGVGESMGEREGDNGLGGGVVGLTNVGVGGTNAS
jgi:hypothetical protein